MNFEDESSPSSPSSPENTLPTISTKRKAGRKKFKETRHPIYQGVRRKNGDKWVSEVREPKKKSRIWLGTFPTPEMAARAYDVAVLALRGEMASLNFPDSANLLPRAKSCSARDIQLAAVQAARDFLPADHVTSSSPSSLSKRSVVSESSSSVRVFVDEEAMFNMPVLIDSMAEGLLLTPPSMQRGFNWGDMVGHDMDLTLWAD